MERSSDDGDVDYDDDHHSFGDDEEVPLEGGSDSGAEEMDTDEAAEGDEVKKERKPRLRHESRLPLRKKELKFAEFFGLLVSNDTEKKLEHLFDDFARALPEVLADEMWSCIDTHSGVHSDTHGGTRSGVREKRSSKKRRHAVLEDDTDSASNLSLSPNISKGILAHILLGLESDTALILRGKPYVSFFRDMSVRMLLECEYILDTRAQKSGRKWSEIARSVDISHRSWRESTPHLFSVLGIINIAMARPTRAIAAPGGRKSQKRAHGVRFTDFLDEKMLQQVMDENDYFALANRFLSGEGAVVTPLVARAVFDRLACTKPAVVLRVLYIYSYSLLGPTKLSNTGNGDDSPNSEAVLAAVTHIFDEISRQKSAVAVNIIESVILSSRLSCAALVHLFYVLNSCEYLFSALLEVRGNPTGATSATGSPDLVGMLNFVLAENNAIPKCISSGVSASSEHAAALFRCIEKHKILDSFDIPRLAGVGLSPLLLWLFFCKHAGKEALTRSFVHILHIFLRRSPPEFVIGVMAPSFSDGNLLALAWVKSVEAANAAADDPVFALFRDPCMDYDRKAALARFLTLFLGKLDAILTSERRAALLQRFLYSLLVNFEDGLNIGGHVLELAHHCISLSEESLSRVLDGLNELLPRKKSILLRSLQAILATESVPRGDVSPAFTRCVCRNWVQLMHPRLDDTLLHQIGPAGVGNGTENGDGVNLLVQSMEKLGVDGFGDVFTVLGLWRLTKSACRQIAAAFSTASTDGSIPGYSEPLEALLSLIVSFSRSSQEKEMAKMVNGVIASELAQFMLSEANIRDTGTESVVISPRILAHASAGLSLAVVTQFLKLVEPPYTPPPPSYYHQSFPFMLEKEPYDMEIWKQVRKWPWIYHFLGQILDLRHPGAASTEIASHLGEHRTILTSLVAYLVRMWSIYRRSRAIASMDLQELRRSTFTMSGIISVLCASSETEMCCAVLKSALAVAYDKIEWETAFFALRIALKILGRRLEQLQLSDGDQKKLKFLHLSAALDTCRLTATRANKKTS